MATLKDKIPPHNLEAEMATLGALLLDGKSIETVISYLRPDRFSSIQHQKIFSAMLSLFNKSKNLDILTVIEELRTVGDLDAVGGHAYISSLTDVVPTSANIEYYAKIVYENAVRRDIIGISSKMISSSYDETKEVRGVLEEAQKLIFDLTDTNQTASYMNALDSVTAAFALIEKIYRNKGQLSGIPSGFTDLDTMTNGFHAAELIILGARPSQGKTALALSMVKHIAIDKKIPSLFFSLEMPNSQLMLRLISQVSHVSSQKIKSGRLTMGELQTLGDACGLMYDCPLYIVDTPNMKLLDLRAMARRLRTQVGIEIIFIDYMTLIQSEDTSKGKPIYEIVSEISSSLKSLARELNIPIVVLSQVGRDAQGRAPTMADIRGSGSIEQDADVIMFIHRETQKEEKGQEKDRELPEPAELILAKQRNGPIGTIDIQFMPHYTQFVNLARQ